MKIATFNVNGVKGRMPRLLEWLEETRPDIACLQEIKTGDATFPHEPIEGAGYRALWHGMPRHHGVAILARADRPAEVRRGLPGDDADGQARYLEADVGNLRVASVYLPNGNPVGSDNWHYKLRWFERFNAYAAGLIAAGRDVVLCGDFNVVPTNNDIYNAGSWRFDAVLQPQTAGAVGRVAGARLDGRCALPPSDRAQEPVHVLRQRIRVSPGGGLSHGLPFGQPRPAPAAGSVRRGHRAPGTGEAQRPRPRLDRAALSTREHRIRAPQRRIRLQDAGRTIRARLSEDAARPTSVRRGGRLRPETRRSIAYVD